MFDMSKFFGSTTVGERGQIVLPVELRKKYEIKAGNKLLVIGGPHGEILLFKAELINQFLKFIESEKINLKKLLKENNESK